MLQSLWLLDISLETTSEDRDELVSEAERGLWAEDRWLSAVVAPAVSCTRLQGAGQGGECALDVLKLLPLELLTLEFFPVDQRSLHEKVPRLIPI